MNRFAIITICITILAGSIQAQTPPTTFYGFKRGATKEVVRKQLGNAPWNDIGLDVSLGQYAVTSKGYTYAGRRYDNTVMVFTREKEPRLTGVSLFLKGLTGEQAMSILETFEEQYRSGIVRDRISAKLRASCGFTDGTTLSVAIYDQDEKSVNRYRVQISITWR